jgi:hypothetical protein
MAQWVIADGLTFRNLDQMSTLTISGSGSVWTISNLPGIYATVDDAFRAAQRLTNAVEVDTLTD